MCAASPKFALDFSKAFDRVRYFTLLEKLACVDIPHNVFNWLVIGELLL